MSDRALPLGRVLRERPGVQAVLWLVLSAVLMFPLCLWLGAWWGRVMAMMFRER